MDPAMQALLDELRRKLAELEALAAELSVTSEEADFRLTERWSEQHRGEANGGELRG